MSGANNKGGSMMRLGGLLRKETRQILRDPSALVIALVMPVVLLLLFGYGVSLDAQDVPVAVVMEDAGPEAATLLGRFQISKYFTPVTVPTMRQAVQLMDEGVVDGIVRMRSDFARQLLGGGDAPVQLVLDAVDANRAGQIRGYVNGIYQQWLKGYMEQQGRELKLPATVAERMWFNETRRSQNSLVPGLLVLNMTLVGALLTALVMAREWERGTMEALLVTPVRVWEILVGKLLPYYVLGMAGMALSVLMSVFLFDVPLRGPMPLLAGGATLFLLAALGMGLLISVLTRNQFLAGQAAILATFLPAFFLSGLIFDLSATPMFIRVISRFIPAYYFTGFVKTMFLVGAVWETIRYQLAALTAMAAFFLLLSFRKTRKRLE